MMAVAVSAQWYQNDAADVAAAKAEHYAAYVAAAARNGVAANPIYYYNYAPNPVQDTPEVQLAKAQHFAAHAAARNLVPVSFVYQNDAADVAAAKAEHYAAYVAAAARNGVAVNPIYYNYVPVPVQDTPEVQAAKAEFFAAYAEAAARAAVQPENEQ